MAKPLPNNLRKMRRKAGLTLVQLGKHIGLSHAHLSNMERGVRKLISTRWNSSPKYFIAQ
ncbi:MAG: helix-turn-helix transcriptional regulator [Sphingobium sp.]